MVSPPPLMVYAWSATTPAFAVSGVHSRDQLITPVPEAFLSTLKMVPALDPPAMSSVGAANRELTGSVNSVRTELVALSRTRIAVVARLTTSELAVMAVPPILN